MIDSVAVRRNSNVSWGAVLAGALIALAFQVTFMTLGSAIGFTVYDPANGDSLGGGSIVRFGVYTFLTSLISVFAGAYASGRLAGYRDRFTSGLHGLATWAVVAVVAVFTIGSGVGAAARLAGTVAGGAAQGLASATGAVASSVADKVDINPSAIASGAKQLLRDTGKKELDPTRMENEAKALPTRAARAQANGENGEAVVANKAEEKANAFDRDAAANVMAKRMNISKSEAESLIAQGEEKAAQLKEQGQAKLEEVKAKGVEAAQAATRIAAGLSWIATFSLVIGAIAAVFGGAMGGSAVVEVIAVGRQDEARRVA